MYKHATLKISFAFVLLFSMVSSYGAIPSGYYYFAQNKSKAELKTVLHTYCSPLQELDYGSGEGFTWQGFYYTDRNATTNTVVDMYSDSVRYFNGFSSVDGMHNEFVDRDSQIDFDTEMKRIQKNFKVLLADEKQSQSQLINAFKTLGYDIEL